MDSAAYDCENGQAASPPDEVMRFIDPDSGKLVPLVLQSLCRHQHSSSTTKWIRIRHSAPFACSLSQFSYWIASPLLVEGSHDHILTTERILKSLGRLATSLPALYAIVLDYEICATQYKYAPSVSRNAAANQIHFYPPVLSLDHSPLDSAHLPRHHRRYVNGNADSLLPYSSNVELDASSGRQSPASLAGSTMMANLNDPGATSRPRFLCYVEDFEQKTYNVIHVSSHLAKHGNDVDTEFIFVSYTRQQFRVNTEEEINAWPHYKNETVRQANRVLATQDRKQLTNWAIDAARRAGKRAFWIDFECVRDQDGMARFTSKSDDVYRICDVVRASHSMIIAIGPSVDTKIDAILSGSDLTTSENSTTWLRHWGSRLWTLPELLLSPGEHRVKLYVSGDASDPVPLAKRNFAERAWDDAELIKELVNHYEGSAQLTQLRLISTALQCFSSRKTDTFSPGDVAYAIMGLLPNSQRPRVLQSDSGFQAFVRLSLANDGGDFVQRLLCLSCPRDDSPWYDTDDVWGARLTDVRAENRVAKVLEDDVLAIDGVHGTTIQWDDFDARIISGEVAKGWASGVLLVSLLAWGLFSRICYVEYYIIDSFFQDQLPGIINRATLLSILPCTIIFAIVSPILYIASRKKVRNPVKPQIVGIEGHVNVSEIETYLWGFDHGRLRQIPGNTSVLHDHVTSPADHKQQFTLVDTYSMTVFHIRAARPPTALFIMGQEADSLRALLCSYDHHRDVFIKETMVLTGVDGLDRMRRVRRFKLRQNAFDAAPDQSATHVNDNKKPFTPWMFELVFATILILRTKVDIPFIARENYLGSNTAYSVSFICAQVLAWYLVTQVSIPRIFRVAVSCKAFSLMFSFLASYGLDGFHVGSIYAGAVDSILITTFFVVILSWSRPSQLAWRLLAFGLAPDVAKIIFQTMPYPFYVNTGTKILYLLLTMCLAMLQMRFIGTPTEVSWLSSHHKAQVAKQSVLSQFEDAGWRETKWRSNIQIYAMFALSMCCSFAINDSPVRIYIPLGLEMLVMSVTFICSTLILRQSSLFKFPTLMVVITLVTVGTVAIKVSSSHSLLNSLMELREFVIPLLWLSCVESTSTIPDLFGMIGAAHFGWALAVLIKSHFHILNFWIWNVCVAGTAIILMAVWQIKQLRQRRGYIRI